MLLINVIYYYLGLIGFYIYFKKVVKKVKKSKHVVGFNENDSLRVGLYFPDSTSKDQLHVEIEDDIRSNAYRVKVPT